MLDLTKLSERKLTELYNKRSALSSANCKALIDAGFGLMKGSQIREREAQTDCGEPLFREYRIVNDMLQEVIDEMSARNRYHGSLKPIRRRA